MNFLIDESSRYYFWQSAFRRFCRDRLALLGSVILLIIILGVTIGPWIYQTPIDKIDFSQMAALPSWEHPLGTNDLDAINRFIFIFAPITFVIISSLFISRFY